tara:strand:+ start:221 stop:652 length:432 start_codon:yes stop_codon:yes gene_type:complete
MEESNKKLEEDFCATIKLITGEEIMARVSYMPDDDSLVLENPMCVKSTSFNKENLRVNGFALTEWIHSTFDQMFVLPRSHVLTMTEVEDKKIERFYNETVKKMMVELSSFRDACEPQEFTRDMGNLGSARETRNKLEDLYKRS